MHSRGPAVNSQTGNEQCLSRNVWRQNQHFLRTGLAKENGQKGTCRSMRHSRPV